MAEKAANSKTAEHSARAEHPAPAAGPQGGVLAPPAYGIDFLDREPEEGRRGGWMIQRKADPAAGGTPPPNASYPAPSAAAALTLAPSASFEEIVDVMRVIDKIKPSASASGLFTTAYQGKEITLSSAEVETVRAAARSAMSSALTRSISRRNQAVARYQGQEETNGSFPLTSRAVKAYAWISSFGNYANPGEAIDGQSAIVNQEAALAQAALANGTFAEAVYHVSAVDAASERASLMVQAYIDQLISGGGRMETGLTFTRNAAFITVGVLATIISGGAALGLGAEVVGTGIGGLTVAQTATVVSVGAPILANVSSAAIQTAEGDHVDWGRVVVDTLVQVLLARFGGKLSAGIAGKLAGNPATQTLARQAMATLVSGSATHVISQAFTATVSAAYETLRGRDVTWAQLLDAIIESLSDPVGWFMVALSSAVHLTAQVKVANALPKGPAKQRTSEEEFNDFMQWSREEGGEASVPRIKGKSEPRIDDHKVPSKLRPPPKPGMPREEAQPNPKLDLEDLPAKPGETQRQAVARVKTLIGKKLSDHSVLEKLWNESKDMVLQKEALTQNNYEDLYDRTRDAFYRRVRSDPAATKLFNDAGFALNGGNQTAPVLAGVNPAIPVEDTRVSLDHVEEKAQGNNWTKALDAKNLRMEFSMPNTERENKQMRHPELRQ